ncbi:TetR/AcrR family transcriptional regulator [Geomicrobium sp. JSM 1781026]|uniref:TetR/AcrR family transcriptional regulator n=1 Tax=Geomicrobium sp. JSM 1781026 TaxID=3344580 RepID=UPI0035BF9D04
MKRHVPAMVKDEVLIKKRREQMVKAAVQLFHEKGFHRTTTREIAKASGFSIGTLYEYIGSKEDVLYLVCDAVHDGVKGRFNELLEESSPGIERFKHLIRSLIQVMDEMQDEVLVMYQESKSLPKDALTYVLDRDRSMTDDIRNVIVDCRERGEIIASDQEIQLLSENIMTKGYMWTFRRWALRKNFSLEEYTELQLQDVMRSIRTQQ